MEPVLPERRLDLPGATARSASRRPGQGAAESLKRAPTSASEVEEFEALDIAGELTEEDVESGRLESLCVKWVADEAETLSGASLMLRDFAERLLELELDGWQLVDPSTVVTASW